MKPRSATLYLIAATTVAALCFATQSATAAEDDNVVPQDVFDGMRESFKPAKAKGGQWWIEVNDGKCKMGKGRIEKPTFTFIASDKDWVALSNGKLGGTRAYLTGRLKMRGDKKWARKLDEMFP
jgi:putative sterol carrier protein